MDAKTTAEVPEAKKVAPKLQIRGNEPVRWKLREYVAGVVDAGAGVVESEEGSLKHSFRFQNATGVPSQSMFLTNYTKGNKLVHLLRLLRESEDLNCYPRLVLFVCVRFSGTSKY